MKNYKKLNIRGTLLDRNQLAKHIEKTAADHNTASFSNRNTYPITRLFEDYKFILETYNLLTRHIKLGIKIHSAGEWILDNFYIIEETVKTIQKELSVKKYKNMIGLSNERYLGFARSYVLAEEIVAFSDCKIDRELIDVALQSYQRKKVLSMEELCNISVFLKISLISHIKELCEKIYFSQIQKYKAESIIERIIEKKNINNLKFGNQPKLLKMNDEKLKYSFIEYMSYKLKKYGKEAVAYQNVLEKEVQKLGFTVSEAIQKEHFHIANIKISMGNCITSIKTINRIDFSELFSYMNASEDILKMDPSGIYDKMDEESKNYFRQIIEKKARKHKISEIYISEKIIELCNKYRDSKEIKNKRKSHVGYYLLKKDGIEELNEILEVKENKRLTEGQKSRLYIASNVLIPIYLCFVMYVFLLNISKNILISIIYSILLYIPLSELYLRIQNYVMGKLKTPTLLPKINYEKGIPIEKSTFVVIPTILKSKEKVKEMFDKLEVYYLANKSENLYFALLGDCSEEDIVKTDFDLEVVSAGIELCNKLNLKYKNDNFDRFHFLYRKRNWNDCENSYIGWERKRGLLTTFNRYIKKKYENDFWENTIEKQKENLPEIKYIITLDSDTNLNLKTASKLIGAMSYILNEPIIENDKIIDGYGIMQPRIGMDLSIAQKSFFIELYSMKGGIDCYTNAISDIYQDYFKEGIFTGKGIYDVDIYNEILKNEFPENTILSHDLLEGNFLRCGLLTDVMLLDGYPIRYVPYILRNHRWTRGDWQIIKWLKNSRLNEISKFKIYDNLRRSILPICSLLLIILSRITKYNKINNIILGISITSIIIPYLIDIVNYIIFKESNITGAVYAYKKFSKELNSIKISIIRILLQILFLPYETLQNIDSIIKSLYRMKKRIKLLEWVTAEDADRNSKTDLKSYFIEMGFNIILGIIFLLIPNNLAKIFGIIWMIGPIIAWYISLDRQEQWQISEKDDRYLREVAKRTWSFFESYINEQNNYLIPDNYQEDRINKIVDRTSSTNIGLELLAILSAYDLKFISFKKTIEYLNKVIGTITGLSKWNGHLYNWYNTNTLIPLIPRYISTVDSGNFVGYLYIVKNFLIENRNKSDLDNLINNVNDLIDNTDFSKLYSEKTRLFSIGFNLEENKLTDSYYDFLASEARQASIVAIAKGDVPVKHWNNLSRTLTTLNGYKGLVSWTGTAFEYLMPNINLKRYKGSILDEASKFAIMSQIEYGEKMGIPWGISESGFYLRDLNNNYQYKAFGIPWLGLKRGLEDDLVVSPYSTCLALEDELIKGIQNLKRLEQEGGFGKYGFYEAIDYTQSRVGEKGKEVVKSYMAHHQGLILLSLNNILNNNILKKRFNENPEIEATNILLEERMPVQMIITKENKEKVVKNKNLNIGSYLERIIEKPNKKFRNVNIISNEKYKITIDDTGESISEYDGVMVNNYKQTSELKKGINIYVKNLKNKKIFDVKENAKVIFSPDKAKFQKQENNLRVEEIISLDPNRPIEIRRIKIENLGNQEELLEIITDFEPSMSYKMQEYSHPAFNKLFMKMQEKNENIIFEKRNRNLQNSKYLATTLYTENEQFVDFEYEIEKEKYLGRENFDRIKVLTNQRRFSNQISQTIEPIIAMKRSIKIPPKDSANVNLLISVSENKKEAIDNLEDIKCEEEIVRILNIARVRSEEESKYLRVDSKRLDLYARLLKYIVNLNPMKNVVKKELLKIDSLWKFGISGDNPIILVKIKNIEDMYVVEELINAFEYYRAKKVYLDLVILNLETNVYERFIKESINELISNKQIDYLKNINKGIFILNNDEIQKEDLDVIEFKSRIIIDSQNGGLETVIKELEDAEKEEISIKKERIANIDHEIYSLKKENLLYDNSFGGFSLDGKEYFIYKNKENLLPSVWCNVICNNFFGTVITDNLGGYTWSKNSRLNRLTAWNNDRIIDLPSEIFYIKDEDNKSVWTLNSGIIPNENYYYITHGFGYTKFKNLNDNFNQELEIFVPNEESLKIMKFRIKNLINEDRKIKLLVYVKTVLGEDEILSNGNLFVEEYNNILKIKNVFSENDFQNKTMYITSDLEINSFTGEKDNFFGQGNIYEPDGLYTNLNNKSGFGKNSCVGIEFYLKFKKFEDKNFYIIIGEENKFEEILKIKEKYSKTDKIEQEIEKCKLKWNNILNTVKVKTPVESINIMMNGWLVYQTLSSRLMGRTGYYQSGGAYGFRDQLQDTLGIKYIDSKYLKEQILNCARHQFVEGDVLHWWHNETKKGIRTKFSDDLLWLVYATIEYINFENDMNILDEQIEYLSGNVLSKDEEERYDIYHASSIKENLFEHCVRAINNTIYKGIEPFPKIGVGDWNDGFSNIGPKGKGQSIWLAFFLYDILNKFIPICDMRNRSDLVNIYKECKEKLRKNINIKGWDGRWFKRAITDDGEEIGSINSEECRIDSLSQSWAVMSGAGDNDKKFIAIQEAENYLVDKENKIIKLFDPPFEKSKINPGYIKSYPAGIRENGGQYTHAACWLLIAETMLGFGDKALELAKIINPIEHAKTKEEAKRFKLEPYVVEADLYSNKDLLGRGGWNWYTGSSSWYYKAILEYILGLKIEKGYLKIEPCISKEWKEYEIQYKYKTSLYKIKIKNNKGKNTGVEKFIVNGEIIKNKQILLQDNCKIYNIEVFM